jgi:transcriptional regulator with XRE-family HTH domain
VATVQLAKTIREARSRRGLSLRELGDATGLATSYLNRLERGQVAEPSCHTLRAVAGALQVPYARLMKQAGYYP